MLPESPGSSASDTGTPSPLPSTQHILLCPGKLWPASPFLMTPPRDSNPRGLSPAFQGLWNAVLIQCQRGLGWLTEFALSPAGRQTRSDQVG